MKRMFPALLAMSLTVATSCTAEQLAMVTQVAEAYGYTPDKPLPGPVAIASRLKAMPDGRVCATQDKNGPCLLVFTRSPEGRWRLSGFEGDLSTLKIRR